MAIPTVTKDDLFLAILAMDTYHRGVNQGVKVSGEAVDSAAAGNEIGLARIEESTDKSLDDAIGFFAIQYSWNGKDVYAYRGTDRGFSDLSTTGDVQNGYALGVGYFAGLPVTGSAEAAFACSAASSSNSFFNVAGSLRALSCSFSTSV